MVLARPHARSTIEINPKNSLYAHRHFTEHLVCAFEKSPQKSNLNHESSSLLDRRLKSKYRLHLQQSIHIHRSPKKRSQLEISNWTPGGWSLLEQGKRTRRRSDDGGRNIALVKKSCACTKASGGGKSGT
jgi:hypothetical protein